MSNDVPRVEHIRDGRAKPFRLIYRHEDSLTILTAHFPTLGEARAALEEHVQYVRDHTWREVLPDDASDKWKGAY